VRSLVATLVALGLLLGGCGKDADSDSPSGGTSLTITLVSDEGVDPQTYTLRCDPPGGDHPQAKQACETVEAAGVGVFKPVAKDQPCTQLYGGPQTATVTGTYKGKKVDATFRRTNGCEIDRWEQLGATFFNVPMQ
jgi:hypothetical protein